MKNTNLTTAFGPLIRAFQRYNLTIFIVVLVSGLATAVLMLNATLIQSSDTTGYKSPVDITSFDQATIDRVKQLHTSDESSTGFTLPAGRINPFSE